MVPHDGLGKLSSLLPNKEISFSTKILLTCKGEKFPTKNCYYNSNLEAFLNQWILLCIKHFEVHHEVWFNCFAKFRVREVQVIVFKGKKLFKPTYTPCLSNEEDCLFIF